MHIYQINTFQKFKDTISLQNNICIIPIYYDKYGYSYNSNISLIYIYCFNTDTLISCCFTHYDGIINNFGITSDMFMEYICNIKTIDNIFIYKKQKHLGLLSKETQYKKNIIDIDMLSYYITGKALTYTHTNKIPYIDSMNINNKLNIIIPINIHTNICMQIIESLKIFIDKLAITNDDITNIISKKDFRYLNILEIHMLYLLERNGVFCDKDMIRKIFPDKINILPFFKENYLFNNINPFTVTGRPIINNFGIDLATLNKKDGSRSIITSRFGSQGKIVAIDYDSYQLRLIAFLLHIDIPKNKSLHDYLGENYYFQKKELTPEERDESKNISFKLIYGGIDDKYLEIPFFKNIADFTNTIWKSFIKNNQITTFIFHRPLYNYFFTSAMFKSKLLSYILQNLETERNMMVLNKLFKSGLFDNKYKSKLILYQYDCFIFDVYKEESTFIPKVVEIMEEGGFKTKIKEGPTFNM
jgi:hypothetical protein